METLCACGCGGIVKSSAQGARWVRGHWSKKAHVPRICSYPDCDRKHYANGLCRPHDTQRRAGVEMHAIGDQEWASKSRKAAWARMDDDSRAQRLSALHGGHYTRTPEWRAAKSAEVRESWANGTQPARLAQLVRACACCGERFTPSSGSNIWCSQRCRQIGNVARRIGAPASAIHAIQVTQAGRCAICGEERTLHLDHDHESGRVRGFLCVTCNTGLGKLGDSPEMLRRALAYLEA